MCTYDNTQAEDQFDWLRNAGATSSWRTGPSVDHTLGTALGMKKGKKNKPLALIKKNLSYLRWAETRRTLARSYRSVTLKREIRKKEKRGTGNNTVTLSLVRLYKKRGNEDLLMLASA